MLNFTFKKKHKEQVATPVVSQPEKKIKREQRLFSLFFILLGLSVAAYVIYRLEIRTFEGYLEVKNRDIRLMDDAYIIKCRVEPGDFVKAGDTLFSYVLAGFFMDVINPTSVTSAQAEINRLHLRANELVIQLRTAKQRSDSLVSLLDKLKREVDDGIETIKTVEVKEWELFTLGTEIEQLELLYDVTLNAYHAVAERMGMRRDTLMPPPMYTADFLEENEAIFGKSLLYRIAAEDLLVSSVSVFPGILVYKKEPIVTVFHRTGTLTDMHALALVPPHMISDLEDGDQVKIYVGSEQISEGSISLALSQMLEVDPSKLGVLARTGEVVAVKIELSDNDSLHYKYQINNLPVKIKYRRGILSNYISLFLNKIVNGETGTQDCNE